MMFYVSGNLLWDMMLLCVFILQHSVMKRLHLKERLQVNIGKLTIIKFLLSECWVGSPWTEFICGINQHLPAPPHQLLVHHKLILTLAAGFWPKVIIRIVLSNISPLLKKKTNHQYLQLSFWDESCCKISIF